MCIYRDFLSVHLFAKKTPRTVKEKSPRQHAGDGEASVGQSGTQAGAGSLGKPELRGWREGPRGWDKDDKGSSHGGVLIQARKEGGRIA